MKKNRLRLVQNLKKIRKYFPVLLFKKGVALLIVLVWFLVGTIPFSDQFNSLFIRNVFAAEADVDATASTGTVIHNGVNSTLVVVSNTNAYAFYVDSGGQCVYSKTTNLNAATPTWGAAVQIDSQTDCVHVAVWYDRWTPGDNTGNYIHIITQDSGNDDLWYNRLDVSSDTRLLTASPVSISSGSAPAKTNVFTSGGTLPTVTKSTTGIIYAGVININSSWVHKCSTTCNTASNWTDESPDFERSDFIIADDDVMLLMPQPEGDLLMIVQNITANRLMSKDYDETGDTWDTYIPIDTNVVENATYDGTFGATIDRSSFKVYLAYGDTIAAANSDIRSAIFDPVMQTWTNTTDAVTNAAGAITGVKIALDESSGTIYVAYSRRTTAGTANTGNVYYRTSTTEMTSWSAESGVLNTTADDIYGVRVPILTNQHIYVTWYDTAADDINGNTAADLTPTTSVIEQAVYRIFTNANSTDVGAAYAASNTPYTLTSKGQQFRIRLLLKVTSANLAISGQQFKLQFANKGGGSCSSSTLLYQDVSTTSDISYYNNATPADAAALTANANDPVNGADTIVNQSYEESNFFTNAQGAVNTSQNGKWDFSLYDKDGTSGATYCLRVVKAGGDSLDTLTVYPEVTIATGPSYTQSNFRWYTNANSADVGAAYAAQNTAYTLTTYKQAFRLRMLITAGTNSVAISAANFKLQFAEKGVGTCAAPTGSYADVTAVSAIRYNNNATPADGAALTANANDPTSGNTIRNQTYEEANTFTNSQVALAAGEDGKWDFSLIDGNMAANTTYCIRAVLTKGTALTTYSQYPEITSLVSSVDKSPSTTAANHLSNSPTMVFISDQVGYMFYIDGVLTAVYRKTTDGGTTWGDPVTVDPQNDVTSLAVWYDQWTPGDTTGTYIHIATADVGNDDLWYTRLDTTSDTVTTTISTVTQSGQSGTFDTATLASVTKATNGRLYMGVIDNTDTFVVECTTTCTTATNWTENGTLGFTAFASGLTLMPLASGDIMAIAWDKSGNTIVSRTMTDTTNTWNATVTIDATNAENATYGSQIGATVDKTTNTIYLAVSDDASTLGTDDDVKFYSYSGGTWTTMTDVLTNTTRGVTDVKVALDTTNSRLYCVYTVRTTAGTASTGTIYYKTSDDGGTTWGSEQGPISVTSGDIYGARPNIMSDERISVAYYDATTTTYVEVTLADIIVTIPETPTIGKSPYFIQSTNTYSEGTANSATFTNPVRNGSLIVVAVGVWEGSNNTDISSVTDNFGNTYTLADSEPSPLTGGNTPVAVYYAYNVTGGSSFQVTVNSVNTIWKRIAIHEYAGISASDPLDRTASATAVSAGTSGDTGNTATTTYPYEILFSAWVGIESASPLTFTSTSSFTNREVNTDNVNEVAITTMDKLVSTTGTYNSAVTVSSSVTWRGVLVTFKSDMATVSQVMRHGQFFDSGGRERPMQY